MLAALLVAAVLSSGPIAQEQAAGVIAGIRVQGNLVMSDDEVIRLAGIALGAPVGADTIKKAESALNSSRRFQHVEVLQRFASLSDPTQVLIVIIVDEGPVKLKMSDGKQTIVRAGGPHLLFMPLLGYEDGYGLSYGAQFARANPVGGHSRLSFPLTWGGDKHAGADLDKEFSGGPLTRAQASFSVSRRTNPFYEQDDSRVKVSVRGERQLVRQVTVGAEASVQRVSFLLARDRVTEAGVDIAADTRRDPMLSRNAVFGRAAWSRVSVVDGVSASRTFVGGGVHVGLLGQAILALHAERDGADQPLPPYLKPLLGGMDTLRGFRAGYKAGDVLVAGSAEVRVPLTSPLSIGKFGVRGFVDAGTAYQHGERYRDQTIDRGVGGGVWFAATAFHMNLDVAHGVGASTRLHFGTSLSF